MNSISYAIPPTAEGCTRRGLPWFDYYDVRLATIADTKALKGLKSVAQLGKEKGDVPLPENESVTAEEIIEIRKGLRPGQVREGSF